MSLAPLIPLFDNSGGIEDYEFLEAIEILGKVHPRDWPEQVDIAAIYPGEVIRDDDDPEMDEYQDFSEKTTSEKVEEVLRHTIESVFGERVDKVRATGGKYFEQGNNYGREGDGTFKGIFEYHGSVFDFSISPDERGWTCEYRMSPASFDSLPPIPPEEVKKKDYSKGAARRRGWG